MPVLLRNFLYLDEPLTSTYLAQLEGGVYDEEEQSTTQRRERSGSAGASAGPLQGQLGRGSSGEERTTRRVRQTPEAAYGRLESLLETQDGIQWLEAFDDAIWHQLRRGELVAIEGTVAVPTLYQLAELASGVGPLMELMRSIGEDVDADAEQAIAGMAQLGQVFQNVVAITRPGGAPDYAFVCPLKRDSVRGDLASLNGDSVVVGSFQRRLKADEKYSLVDALGLGALPRTERQKLERDLAENRELGELVISPPAAIISPLAVYR